MPESRMCHAHPVISIFSNVGVAAGNDVARTPQGHAPDSGKLARHVALWMLTLAVAIIDATFCNAHKRAQLEAMPLP